LYYVPSNQNPLFLPKRLNVELESVMKPKSFSRTARNGGGSLRNWWGFAAVLYVWKGLNCGTK